MRRGHPRDHPHESAERIFIQYVMVSGVLMVLFVIMLLLVNANFMVEPADTLSYYAFTDIGNGVSTRIVDVYSIAPQNGTLVTQFNRRPGRYRGENYFVDIEPSANQNDQDIVVWRDAVSSNISLSGIDLTSQGIATGNTTGSGINRITSQFRRVLIMCAVKNLKRGGDGGVSEVLGFLLIFTIIIAGIGLVTLYGYPMLLQQQSSANEKIMEKNMIVLQNDLKSLSYNMVPYSETSLNVGGGTLTVYNMSYSLQTSSNFTISDTSGIINPPVTFQPGDMRYESTGAQTEISLENGAVVMRMLAENGSTMLAEPRWFYDAPTSTAVIYLIGFNTTDVIARSGVGTVAMELDQTNYTVYSIPPGDTVTVQYTPNPSVDYSVAWGNYFTNTVGLNAVSNGVYAFPSNVNTLVVYRYEIRVKSV